MNSKRSNTYLQAENSLIEHMFCTHCQKGKLVLTDESSLNCISCGKIYPQSNGYFDFGVGSGESDYWDQHWSQLAASYDKAQPSRDAEKFHQIIPEVFKGKIVIDLGSGICKNLESYLKYQPKALIFSDLSGAVNWGAKRWYIIRQKYPHIPVLFLKADIYNMPIRRKDTSIVYTCSGLFNILENQVRAVEDAMKYSDYIFFLYNSPLNSFGRFFYRLNPVRKRVQAVVRSEQWKTRFSCALTFIIYPLIKLYIYSTHRHLNNLFDRSFTEVLIFDWVFSSPESRLESDAVYQGISPQIYRCQINENMGWISRVMYYQINQGGN